MKKAFVTIKNNFKNVKKISKKNMFIVIAILVVFVVGIIFVPRSFAQPVKSVELVSDTASFEDKTPGSWKVDKSAKWTSKGEAEITFDVDTIMKSNTKYTDVLFVLDVSGSMNGEKLDRVKADSIQLIESLLSNDKNNAGIITFDSDSSIISTFSNSKEELINQINSLTTAGCTNYYQALVNVDKILKDYVKEKDRECMVLFLTDGYPNEDTPNEETQYSYLRQQYPFITINGIQYEMGTNVLDPVKKVSDNQFIADMETLNNVLFDASITPITYDNFEITDYIDTNYFFVEDENNIKVSQGSVSFDKDTQKVKWDVNGLKTGSKAKMTIKVKLKDEFIGQGGEYPTNKSEEIHSKLGETEDNVVSDKTPVLLDNYKVIYDGNAPDGSNVTGVPTEESKLIFDVVGISETIPVCEGYQFKGWEITTRDVKRVNNDYFVMPEEDVVIKAKWSKLNITKSMTGTVKEVLTLYKQVENDANSNNHAKLYTGDTSTFKGKENVYYYYGETPNNNVLFGGFCWRMVRTTDTGGVKMVYNGEPDSEGKCGSDRGQHVGYGNRTISSLPAYYSYGTDYTYDEVSKMFILTGYTEILKWNDVTYPNLIGKYTCQNTTGSCSTLYYVSEYNSNTSAYILPINSTTTYSQIGVSQFNENRSSPADVGYMYNKRYAYQSKNLNTEGKIDAETIEIEETDYDVKSNTVVTDEETNIYSFDSSTKKWTSNNHKDGSTSTIELGVKEEGTYYFNYAASSEQNYDKATLYLDGTKKGEYSGTTTGKIRLENLTLTSVIKVEYTKDSSSSSGTDNVIFSIDKPTGVEVDNRWLYGNSFTYDGENYTITDIEKAELSQDSSKLTSKHYTCWNTSETCKKVSYVYYLSGTTAYYIDLENGTNVEKALDEMLYDENVNTTNSTIKTVIDAWYSKNMTEYTDYFEDTVWCNDRSMNNQSANGWNPNGGSNSTYLQFRSYSNGGSLTCPNKNDSFTVDSKNGNEALTYPVGLVTIQEQVLAYYGSNSPLSSGSSNWSLSPYSFDYSDASGWGVYSSGDWFYYGVNNANGVRPAVSLRAGIEYLEGDGTAAKPYVIDMDS